LKNKSLVKRKINVSKTGLQKVQRPQGLKTTLPKVFRMAEAVLPGGRYFLAPLPTVEKGGGLRKITEGELIDAGSALPVDDVDQFPRILIELELNLALFIHGELASGIENASALALVCIVDIEFPSGEVEGL